MEKQYINSISDYLQIIERLHQAYRNSMFHSPVSMDFIFRGMESEKYQLLPTIFRTSIHHEILDTEEQQLDNHKYLTYGSEQSILKSFKAEAVAYTIQYSPNNDLEWMELAQHYGVPTRLLDWTSNPLVALYFACESNSSDDAVIWICNASNYTYYVSRREQREYLTSLNDAVSRFFDDEEVNNEAFLPVYPSIFIPFYYDLRMSAQSSCFMMWGSNEKSLEEQLEENAFMKRRVRDIQPYDIDDVPTEECVLKVFVHQSEKQILMRKLDQIGINRKTLFPGLDGVGQYIERKFRFDYNEFLRG